MKVKRFTLLFLLLALTVALLVACDGDATTTAGSACPYHGYDRQGDGVCDNCGEPFCASNHTNRNNDNYCDWCGMFLAGGGQTTATATAAMPAEARFTITSDDLACNVGGDNVTFSVAEGELGSFSATQVQFYVDGINDVGAAFDGGKMTATKVGTVTVRARLGSIISENAITVTILPRNTAVALAIDEALEGRSPYLGMRVDIGLPSGAAAFYSFEGGDEYMKIDEDGMLCFIGVPGRQTSFTLRDREDRQVKEYIYGIASSGLATAVRQALLSSGDIASQSANIPFSMMARVTALTLSPSVIAEEAAFLVNMPALETLDLGGAEAGDLSYLKGMAAFKELKLSGAVLDLSDGGVAVGRSLKALTAIEVVDIRDSFGSLNRYLYDTLVTFVADGEITLKALDGVDALTAATVDAFSENVFFSLSELRARVGANGEISAAGGYHHFILYVPAYEKDTVFEINVKPGVSSVNLYGDKNTSYVTPVTITAMASAEADVSIALNFYQYSINAPAGEHAVRLSKDGAFGTVTCYLSVRAGDCHLRGADWYPISDEMHHSPTSGIYSTMDLSITDIAGRLYLYGGTGRLGDDGIDGDTSNPDRRDSPKWGGRGKDGAYALVAYNLVVAEAKITARGGDGGAGGAGGDAGVDVVDSYSYGLNGGHGGGGGDGGGAVLCNADTATKAVLNSCDLQGGNGGRGGAGGKGALLGADGNPGEDGWYGLSFFKTNFD